MTLVNVNTISLSICVALLLSFVSCTHAALCQYIQSFKNQVVTDSLVRATIGHGAAHVELINCQLTKAGLAEICKSVWELKISAGKLDKKAFSNLPANKVTDLVFNKVTFAPGALAGLKSFPNLRTLSLSECKLEDDSDLRFFRDVGKTVSVLRLNGKSVTDQTLEFLDSYVRLRQLYLEHTGVRGKSLALIPNPDRINIIYLRDSDITPEGLLELKRFPNLRELEITQTEIRPADFEALGILKNLRKLQFQLHDDGDGWFRVFSKQPGLSIFGDRLMSVKRFRLSDDALLGINNVLPTETLSLDGCPVTDKGLAVARYMPQLSRIVAIGCRIEGTAFCDSSSFSKVKVLFLDQNPLSVAGISCIGKLESIEKLFLESALPASIENRLKGLEGSKVKLLWLSGNRPLSSDFFSISKMPELKTLAWQDLALDEVMAKSLSMCSNLDSLLICDSDKIDLAAAEKIARMHNLRRLDLSIKLDKRVVRYLRQNMRHCKISLVDYHAE